MGRHHDRGTRFAAAGFTLVELLVVIAIVALLMGILLPALSRVMRVAQVLTCPIAYIDWYNQVWLCDPTGERRISVSNHPAYGGWVRWSPRGDRLAFMDRSGRHVVVVNPASGETRLVDAVENPTWIDNDTLMGTKYCGSYNELWRVDVQTGKSSLWRNPKENGEPCGQIAAQYEPILSPGYVLSEPERLWTPMADIVMRGKNWHLKKVIWSDPAEDVVDAHPRVDFTGEWVAWTRAREPGPSALKLIAMKPMQSHRSDPPRLAGLEFPNAAFCDWTPQGHMLVVLSRTDGQRTLAIMTREGKIMRELATPTGLQEGCDAVATWRRYERW